MEYTIREKRRALRLTQQHMADAIGVTLGMYNMLENGKRRMNEDHMALIAKALGEKPSDLIAEVADDDAEFLAKYRKLPDEDRDEVDRLVSLLYAKLPREGGSQDG